jgi:hypothetical protein
MAEQATTEYVPKLDLEEGEGNETGDMMDGVAIWVVVKDDWEIF